jgi:hypothetical protein
MSKTLTDITLEQLMAEDYEVWVGKNRNFGFDIQIDSDKETVCLDGVHPFAMDSFADFCRQFLYSYDRCIQRGAA